MFIIDDHIYLIGGFESTVDKKPADFQKIGIPNPKAWIWRNEQKLKFDIFKHCKNASKGYKSKAKTNLSIQKILKYSILRSENNNIQS